MSHNGRHNGKHYGNGKPDDDEPLSPKQAKFLAAFAKTGSCVKAAEFAGVARTSHYNWLKKDSNYKRRFRDARREAAQRLEDEARRRAVEGVEVPVYYKGEECGKVIRYSDRLLAFLLSGAMPKKYRQRREVRHYGSLKLEFESREVKQRRVMEEIARLRGSLGAGEN